MDNSNHPEIEVCTFKMKIHLKRCTFNLQMTVLEKRVDSPATLSYIGVNPTTMRGDLIRLGSAHNPGQPSNAGWKFRDPRFRKEVNCL